MTLCQGLISISLLQPTHLNTKEARRSWQDKHRNPPLAPPKPSSFHLCLIFTPSFHSMGLSLMVCVRIRRLFFTALHSCRLLYKQYHPGDGGIMSVGTAKSQGTDEFSLGCVSIRTSHCSCGHSAAINTHLQRETMLRFVPLLRPAAPTPLLFDICQARWYM